ncbi:hypothetical protein ACEWY4_017668 [Coilia grayii]|uniref:Pentraxin (PTX) domain-containing protein n=1 Tax=Coilia grayii TaxID=363190 RepID=A0ABD1JHQ8_9TELE
MQHAHLYDHKSGLIWFSCLLCYRHRNFKPESAKVLWEDMAMNLLLALLLVYSCNADVQDLTGKLMSFSGDASYAELYTSKEVDRATVCLRFRTENNHKQCLFSLALNPETHALQMIREKGDFSVEIGFGYKRFRDMFADKANEWNSMCMTLNTKTDHAGVGLVQMWVNEMRSLRKAVTVSDKISSSLRLKMDLGKRRPFYKGETPGSSNYIPYLGEVKDVHVWDSILSPCEIKTFIDYKEGCNATFTPGNVINWKALNFSTDGTEVGIKQA